MNKFKKYLFPILTILVLLIDLFSMFNFYKSYEYSLTLKNIDLLKKSIWVNFNFLITVLIINVFYLLLRLIFIKEINNKFRFRLQSKIRKCKL